MSATAGLCTWRDTVSKLLPTFGHRNWIVVADSAYPAHSSGGIEVILTDEEHINVVRSVLELIDASPHLSASVFTDMELAFVDESDAPGVSQLSEELDSILRNRPHSVLRHEEIIATIAQAAQRFRIVVVKTMMSKPYTSVFIELGCGYWTAEQERRMRLALASANGND